MSQPSESTVTNLTPEIIQWFTDLGRDDLDSRIVAALVREKLVADPGDLYILLLSDLACTRFGLGEFGLRRSDPVIKLINACRHIPLEVFLAALRIPMLDKALARAAQAAFPGQFQSLSDWLDPKKLALLGNKIIDRSTMLLITDGIKGRRALITKLLTVGVTVLDQA